MRPISMWSDHAAPVRGRWWKAPSRRRARSSTGLKILLAAGVVVAGVIGISGVYPRVIDAQWAQDARTYASTPTPDVKTTAPDAKIARRADVPASTQPPARSTAALTRGEAPVAPPGRAAAVSTPRPAAVVTAPPVAPASKPVPVEPEPLALAESPDAAANADAPPTPAPTVAAKPVAPVVKRRIVSRAERPRRGGFTIGPFAFGGSPFRM
jgi:cytoskeletal protein RodZ